MADFNRNWTKWVMILVIALGAILEGIKRLPSDSALRWDREALRATGEESRPYSIRVQDLKTHPRPQPVAPRIAARPAYKAPSREELEAFVRANTPTKTEFAHGDGKGKEGAKSKKKKASDDEWEYVIDPLTGKKIRRRKRKPKVADEKKEEIAKQEDSKSENDEDKSGGSADSQTVVTTFFPPPPAGRDEIVTGLDEWVRRLLNYPDPKETNRFIDHYKRGLVTADTYYKIIDLMIEDSRLEMKKLGVLCAGMVPSTSSFHALAKVTKAERSDSPVRAEVDRFLPRYSDLAQLSVLESVLRAPGDDPEVTALAARLLEASARRWLAPERNRPKNPGSPPKKDPAGQTTTVRAHTYAGYFQRFVPVLNGLTRSPNAEISGSARNALNSLESLLHLEPTQVATAQAQ